MYAEINGISHGSNKYQMSYSAGTLTNNASNSIYTVTSSISTGDNSQEISNCVSLIEQINLGSSTSNYGRIVSGRDTNPSLSNNYAFSGMLLQGSIVTSSDPNSMHGLDKTAAQLKQRSTYENGLGWDFYKVWEMGPPSYPFPILKWQKGVVKLPQGFRVIQD